VLSDAARAGQLREVGEDLCEQPQRTVSIHDCECPPGWPVSLSHLLAEVHAPG
jgi:hypothetical protein